MPTKPSKPRVLIIDDEWTIRDVLSTILEAEGFEVETADDGAVGIEKLEARDFDLVITDLKMPRTEGMEVLKHLRGKNSSTLAIVATGFGSIESAVEALKNGAYDYITKPFHLDEIRSRVRNARDYQRLRNENRDLRRQIVSAGRVDALIGNSPPMLAVKELIRTVADSDSTVLILGERGTGKELAAKAIHFHSGRARRRLIPVNCGAIPEELLESELFGHVKGAFTGATSDRAGRFELANGGTIFLDEIAEMSPRLQVKLLRVLQEHQLEPVGSTRTLDVDVRVIAATNRNLEAEVGVGRFREDLFDRLNVIPVRLPPLRERREDIALLLAHFIELFRAAKGRAIQGFDPEALAALVAYDWPGNVRELENLIERLSILHAGQTIGPDRLPERFLIADASARPPAPGGIPETGVDLNSLVEDYELRLIRSALERSQGVKTRAARLLGIKRTTLVEKMRRSGMRVTADS